MNARQKWECFNKNLEITWNVYQTCREHLDSEFSKEWKSFYENRNEQAYQEYLHEIEFPFRNTLNCSILIAFCSLFENVVIDITKEVVQKYDEKIKKEKGNWLIKNLRLLNSDHMVVDTNSEEVKFLSYYILIRNCIVHNGGKVSEFRNSKELIRAIEDIKKYDQKGNYNMIGDKNDSLFIASGLISDFVIRIEETIERMLENLSD